MKFDQMSKENLDMEGRGEIESGRENLPAKIAQEKLKTNTKARVVMAGTEKREVEKNYKMEALSFEGLSEARIEGITDYFRYTFNNAFPEYAGCTDCETAVSAPEVFGTGREYVPLDKLEEECNLPDCEGCGEEMKFFHDKDMTREKLAEKFGQEGKIVLLTDEDTDEIKGMTFGYYDSLAGVVEKEWGHPYNYMKKEYQDEALKFDVDGAIEKIVASDKGADGGKEVFCWNCIMLDPDARGNFRELTTMFWGAMKDDKLQDKLVVSQVLAGSKIHGWIKEIGYREVDEIFGKEYAFLFGDLEVVCNNYLT